MNPAVSIVIVNWNGRQYLAECLTALQEQSYANFEVILVDNGSTDGSLEFVARCFPWVRTICNDTNVGFAVGNNQAIHETQAEFIVTLNNDTQVEADWLASLVTVAERGSQVGMCASKMLFADRPHIINSTGIEMDPLGIAWDRRGGELDDGKESEPSEVFGPCAGAALYRRAMLDQIGGFDEHFFAYLEDVDLAWRARLAGWRCLYVPQARVYHVHSATGKEGSAFKNRLLGRNKVWTIAKNYGPIGRLLAHLPLIVLYDLAAVLYALFVRGSVSSLQGRLKGLRDLPRVWQQRQAIQKLRQKNENEPWHHYLSPLPLPWRVPARYKHLRDLL